MIVLSISSGYLIDSNYSEYSYYIHDKDEDFLVFIICDEIESAKCGFKISEIFSRTFCKSVYDNRYITNLKNLIEVGIYESLERLDKFLKQKKVSYEILKISVSGGVFKNGKLMIFSLGDSPIFIIDNNYYMYCPVDLIDNIDLSEWRKYLNFSDIILNPKCLVACSDKLNGKLFKAKKENDKITVEPFKYNIIHLVNSVLEYRENHNDLKEKIKYELNLKDDTPLFVSSFDECLIDESLVRVAEYSKLKKSRSTRNVDNSRSLTILKDPNKNSFYITRRDVQDNNILNKKNKKISNNILALSIIILFLCIFACLNLVMYNKGYNGDSIKNNTVNNVILANSSNNVSFKNRSLMPYNSGISNNNLGGSYSICNQMYGNNTNLNSHNNLHLKYLNIVKNKSNNIIVELKDERDLNSEKIYSLLIKYPSRGVYYVLINSKCKCLKFINIDTYHGLILYKNDSMIEFIEDVKDMSDAIRSYKLVVCGNNNKNQINISISRIEIVNK